MKLFFRNFLIVLTLLALCITPCSAAKKKKKRAKHFVSYNTSSRVLVGSKNLSEELNRILRTADPSAVIGIQIKSMRHHDMLYSRNEQRLFIPASILKVFTAQTALLLLGADYKFKTYFLTDAKRIRSGVLEGNLYLVQNGDPSLTYYDIADLTAALKAQHIREIAGNVYVDTSAYDQEQYAPGWLGTDKRFCYGAPISASIINHNCLSLRIAPTKGSTRLTNLMENASDYTSSIQNSVIKKPTLVRSCTIRLGQGPNNTLVVNNCITKGKSPQNTGSVITDVMQYNKSLLTSLFRYFNIRIEGEITPGIAPDRTMMIAAHESHPLSSLVTKMLKSSDNIIAGSLFKKIGEVTSKQPGSWSNGRNAVTRLLAQQMGVDTRRISVIDGSGLSRYNLMTPAQMMQVLDFAYRNPSTHGTFLSALPLSGTDGTLKHRLMNAPRKVQAKTGSMSGVVALAGYTTSRDKEPLAFVIIVNGRNGLGWKYRAIEDKIVTALTRYTR